MEDGRLSVLFLIVFLLLLPMLLTLLRRGHDCVGMCVWWVGGCGLRVGRGDGLCAVQGRVGGG